MGQVWRAKDTRFENRTVAVKLLREDQTLGDDAERRQRMIARLNALSAARPLDLNTVVDALASALGGRDLTTLRARAEARLGSTPLTTDVVATLFDEFVNDPALNENARLRAKMRRLFRDEANSVANLRHDNIVSIFDYGEFEAVPYLVMDHIEGRTLHQILDQRLSLSLTRKLQLIEDLCAGLAFAHSRQLVHRDIKPANLIIDQTTDSLKILDFGVVRRLGTESTVGIPIGTFCYMSPEQTQGAASLDHRSDIFAVGLVFYEIITGTKAFPAGKNVGDLVLRIQRESPPPISTLVPNVPDRVQQIINKAIAKNPDDRYQDLRDMERDIARIRMELETSDRNEPTMVMKASDLGATIIAKAPPGPAPGRPPLKVPTFSDAPAAAAASAPPVMPPVSAPASVTGTTTPRVAPPPEPPPPRPAPPIPPPVGTSAPAVTPQAPVAAAGTAARPARPVVDWKIPAAAVSAILVLGLIAALVWQQLGGPEQAAESSLTTATADSSKPAATPAPAADAAPVTASEEPPAAASPVGLNTVSIDVRPWARVRVVPANVPEGQTPPTVPAEPLYTPFTIDLAPGDYTLEAENGGLNRNTTFQIKVELGKPQYIVRSMPGFNATKTVDALLAQD